LEYNLFFLAQLTRSIEGDTFFKCKPLSILFLSSFFSTSLVPSPLVTIKDLVKKKKKEKTHLNQENLERKVKKKKKKKKKIT